MARLIPFLTRLGLLTNATDPAEAFDLRLTRINTREARSRRQCGTFKKHLAFKNQLSRPASAALS